MIVRSIIKKIPNKKFTRLLDDLIREIFKLKYPNPYCVTCGRKDGWFHPQKCRYGIQVGHYVSRSIFVLRWDLKNCKPQCLTKKSKLRMFNGKNLSIKDIKIGDKVWGFNKETFEKEVSTIKSKSKFIPEELYEVELEDGKKFFCTRDHKVVANGKWTEIKQMLHNVTAYDILEL